MHNYIQWKQSTVQASSFPNYVRWVSFFQTVINKDDNKFTLEDISKFKSFLENALYRPKNIQYGLSIVRDYINYLVAAEKLDFPIHLFRIKQERSKSHYPLTEEEYEQMLSVVPKNTPMTLQRRLMLMLLHDTGMRGGELFRLRIKDIGHRRAIIENEKNKRSRLVSWNVETDKILTSYLNLRNEIKNSEDYLFISLTTWKGKRKMTTRQLERIVREICLKANIESKIRPHSFRHGFVHRKLDERKPITTVAQMLGHSSTINVLTYAQLSSREIRKAWGIENLTK